MSATVVFTVQLQPSGKYNFAVGTLGNKATTGEKAIAGTISEWLESLCTEAPSDAESARQDAAPPKGEEEASRPYRFKAALETARRNAE